MPLPELVFYWNAYFQLTTDRAVGMGIGPIPWSAIDAYARRYTIDAADEFDFLVQLIRSMDAVFLASTSRDLQKRGE